MVLYYSYLIDSLAVSRNDDLSVDVLYYCYFIDLSTLNYSKIPPRQNVMAVFFF